MSEIADHYRKIADGFSARARAVPAGAWDAPAPCEGWVARDIVRHMVEWMPAMLAPSGVEFPPGPSPDVDPLGAWEHLDATIQAALDDPEQAGRELDMQMGRFTFEDSVDRFCTGDVFLHTWDLARATGLDETLDPDEVHEALLGLEPIDELLRQSGHYGPRVPVPDDADEQTRLIAFIGRQP